MATYDVEIVIPDIPTGGFFKKFWDTIKLKKPLTERKIKKILEDYARDGHRQSGGRHYKKQTGRLRKSTRAEGTIDTAIRLYVDETQADYAKYVIEPRSGTTWKGDPFIDETMRDKWDEVQALISELYDGAVAEWNKTKWR